MDNNNLIMVNENLKQYSDVSLFVPKIYFAFNKVCYDLMVDDMLRVCKITLKLLRDAEDGV